MLTKAKHNDIGVLAANHAQSDIKDQDPPPHCLVQHRSRKRRKHRGGQSKLRTISRHMAVADADHYLLDGRWASARLLQSRSSGTTTVLGRSCREDVHDPRVLGGGTETPFVLSPALPLQALSAFRKEEGATT